MSATFTEVLEATKSSAHNALNWTPGATAGAGSLTVHTARASVTYRVTPIPTRWAGKAFRLVKDGTAGTDAESDAYDVFCAADGRRHECGCKGFIYGRGKPCKHVSAALALIENGWA